MVVFLSTLQGKATESQGKIIKDIVFVFLVDKSHDLLQVIFCIQLRRCHIQLHLLMMQHLFGIPIVKSKRKLTWRIQEVNISHEYSGVITIGIKLEVLTNPFQLMANTRRMLFCGCIQAMLELDSKLIFACFEEHRPKLRPFCSQHSLFILHNKFFLICILLS